MDDISIYSLSDLLDAYIRSDPSPECQEPILYYLSELTGKSVDALSALLAERA